MVDNSLGWGAVDGDHFGFALGAGGFFEGVDEGEEGGIVLVPFVQVFVLADFFVCLAYYVGILAGNEPGEEFVEAGEKGGRDLEVDEGVGFDDFDLHRF